MNQLVVCSARLKVYGEHVIHCCPADLLLSILCVAQRALISALPFSDLAFSSFFSPENI